MIECGIGTNNPNIKSSMGIHGIPGASLRMWRDYFPNAEIIGLDIDSEILFDENRIKTYYCDQTCIESIDDFAKKAQLKINGADIIIDDGLHDFHAGVSFFEGVSKYLSENGIYVIEDVSIKDMEKYKRHFYELSELFSTQYINLSRPKIKIRDNRLVVIRKNM